MASTPRTPIPPVRAGLTGKCPSCGEGHLFSGFLDIADRCDVCGEDFGGVNSGDGPAVFAIMIIGFIVVGAALVVELRYEPPLWVHLALWFPLTAALVLGLLRPMKGVLAAMQIHHKAQEGRLADE
ncbi:MAG: DUF983 domain-containing protein [Hyphomicrobiaceae bacterium]